MSYDPFEQDRIMQPKREADAIAAPMRATLAKQVYRAIDDYPDLTAEDVAIVLNQVLERVTGADFGPPRKRGENL